jgi:subtilisin family serine protease
MSLAFITTARLGLSTIERPTRGSTAHDRFGVSGVGIDVAVIDSGVTATARTSPGIIAGNGYDSDGRQAGIAPDAGLVSLKVLDATGAGTIGSNSLLRSTGSC